MPQHCTFCDGTGKHRTYPEFTCGICLGEGRYATREEQDEQLSRTMKEVSKETNTKSKRRKK